MDAAKIVVGDIERDGRNMAIQWLRKSVCQSREAPRRHADREIAALNVAGRDLVRRAAYCSAAYRDYSGGAVTTRGLWRGQMGYAVGLDDLTVNRVGAEGVAEPHLFSTRQE